MTRSHVRPSPLFLGILAATVAGGVLTTLDTPLARTAGIVVLVLGGWAVSLCLHEFGHAFVAYRGGDHAVRAKGYLTLDPRHYTDPVLSLVIPLLLLVVGGVPLPGGAVWINHHALRSRGVESLVSLAGPLANLVVGGLLTAVVAAVDLPTGLRWGLSYLALLQIAAFVLNILPVPGLDGFGVLEPYLSYRAREFAAKVRPWAPLALFAALFALPQLNRVFWDLVFALFGTVGGDFFSAAAGLREFMFWR
ncbi:Zn-dependent protease (includes SpoIVFB) [Streptoalloteichus tenebrarius]|uniref:Zn-dependent protease (Includes SpoIVFB) n=1 Tax=Streptoalloteichus tenebrarius (strain ATCC 17920 / DSM 40477 / JCM 4838 / CBS 697.72 / NBRC 16177 / NCIMB 11028 / NRRL B-12390 / A12253. 1 / ISP 5477) TaxID=1933 RepID=A0ABT1HT19_STRSD|nr:site-2 protease family protein [Streptoalloteichus tenebrarius]MCP2258661.1 Zn-dependent protease (includes SpoIVFB) [Streptoalloteichus tenebrarius]BFF02805.1 site-2 protease family protein [Streptoalloteichus tenebrarius]